MKPWHVGIKSWGQCLLILLVLVGISHGQNQDNNKNAPALYRQNPVIMPNITQPPPDDTLDVPRDLIRKFLQSGPVPEWIWGPQPHQRYTLRRDFNYKHGAEAWLIFTADNKAMVKINGKEAGYHDNWQQSVITRVTSLLMPGLNHLEVDVVNDDGPAGFIMSLMMVDESMSVDYVITQVEGWIAHRPRQEKQRLAVISLGKLGVNPWGNPFEQITVGTNPQKGLFQTLPDYQVELLFTVPKEDLGSWVCITQDEKGRLLVSDQDKKGICRITPAPLDGSGPTVVEHLAIEMTAAQGMLVAFGCLYVSVNGGPGSGLYRLRDTDHDDQYDEVLKLASFRGGGEHGPHALRLSPDGRKIVVVAGNFTQPPFDIVRNAEPQTMGGVRDTVLRAQVPEGHISRVPVNWDEDLLLPRQWDGNGHARGILAPGGWIAQTDPDGKTWELFSIGFRNAYDIAFNADGELFAYDSDMEWDMGMPWYRPTRLVHVVSGGDYGWRSGTGCWPSYYADSLPPVLDIGPGSPVGIEFGYGTKFPERYQKALYLLDWTFGTIYAVHLEPHGSSYRAKKEEFLSRSPLPLTDAVVGRDGALYFIVGGRGTQSELFRVRYVGSESTEAVAYRERSAPAERQLRHRLEEYHVPFSNADGPQACIDAAISLLGHPDRFIRYAARIALEHQPVDLWRNKIHEMSLTDVDGVITASIALARQGDGRDRALLVQRLLSLWRLPSLSMQQQLGVLRAIQLVLIRLGSPTAQEKSAILDELDHAFPTGLDLVDRELGNILVFVESPTFLTKALAELEKPSRPTLYDVGEVIERNRGYGGPIAAMLKNAPDQQQIHYAFILRNVRQGWTLSQRQTYFRFLDKARGWSGGASYINFLKNIDNEAFANATDAERLAIEATGARKPFVQPELPKPRGPGKNWTLDELVQIGEAKLSRGRDFKNGQKMFAAARCVVCHRFAGDGGSTGPDLTQLAGRFNLKDLVESIVDPGKVVSDQYKAVTIATHSGRVYTGKIVYENNQVLTLLINPEDPTKVVEIEKQDIEEVAPSPTTLMPRELLNALNEEEVLDLLAYLLSRGNPQDPMFRQ